MAHKFDVFNCLVCVLGNTPSILWVRFQNYLLFKYTENFQIFSQCFILLDLLYFIYHELMVLWNKSKINPQGRFQVYLNVWSL